MKGEKTKFAGEKVKERRGVKEEEKVLEEDS